MGVILGWWINVFIFSTLGVVNKVFVFPLMCTVLIGIASKSFSQDSAMIKVCDANYPHRIEHADTSGINYQWSTGDSTKSIQIDSSDNYTLTVTFSNGDSTIVNYNIIDWAAPKLEWSEVHSGTTYFFNVGGDYLDSATIISWQIDSISYTGQSVTHTFSWFSYSKSYPIFISAENECGSTDISDEICVGTPLSAEPCYPVGIGAAENDVIEFFPNPTTGKITLMNKNASYCRIQIISKEGKVIHKIYNPSSFIDVSHLNSGWYLLEANTREGIVIRNQLILSK